MSVVFAKNMLQETNKDSESLHWQKKKNLCSNAKINQEYCYFEIVQPQ